MDKIIGGCKLIELPTIHNEKGNLSFCESERHIPFAIKRVYHLYDIPGDSVRGGHAHKQLHQFIIAASGSFDVILDTGKEKQRIHLNRSYFGIYIPTMIWRELDNFSSASVCLVFASEYYDEKDYYRDYKDFQQALQHPTP